MTHTEDTLNTVRKGIDEEIAAVEAELAELGFQADGSVDVVFDEGFSDAAHTTSERAKVLSLADGLKQRLEEARAAVSRLERGVYGICEGCGKPIPAERLEAIPTTRLCIECKQLQSRGAPVIS